MSIATKRSYATATATATADATADAATADAAAIRHHLSSFVSIDNLGIPLNQYRSTLHHLPTSPSPSTTINPPIHPATLLLLHPSITGSIHHLLPIHLCTHMTFIIESSISVIIVLRDYYNDSSYGDNVDESLTGFVHCTSRRRRCRCRY
ncbi:unnamed protein product [Brugia pahangi]|uniref:Uncharacterized protein n=1 Tax=Brugia pahangi TaxID=6280 RepID=A0A0N4T1T4_BRUPA|nr:unnamed protein product [Brugia pahangi]